MKNKGIEYDRLNRFVGKWNTEGTIPQSGNTPEIKVKGTDTYEWLPGGFFLLHRADVLIGDDRSQTYEIIGFDNSARHYTMQYFNNKGESGFMTSALDGDQWTFSGEKLQFKGGFNEAGNLFSGTWEQTTDGKTWAPFMNIRLEKRYSFQ